jgi:hypothetical protein
MRTDEDQKREERIYNEAIVVCYDEYEQAAGWHCYLEDRLTFPFKAKCIQVRTISPLKVGEVAEVMNMADQDDCLHEMFVLIRFMDRRLAVPLAQLQPLDADEATEEAVGDWHYWMGKGKEF